jgi:hypothetical protein
MVTEDGMEEEIATNFIRALLGGLIVQAVWLEGWRRR